MRLDKLKIRSSWKNLEDFEIDFDESYDVVTLIGQNGAAKSNLIEAIILIFMSLNKKKPFPFSFDLLYDFNNEKISISGEADKTTFKALLNGKTCKVSEIKTKWLPKYLVNYYSGVSDRFSRLFYDFDLQTRNKTLTDEKTDPLSLREFIYAGPEHGLFALLAFYFSPDKKVDTFLKKFLRIESFDSVLIEVTKPLWAKPNAKAEDFWGARGAVRNVLEILKTNSLAPLTTNIRVQQDFARTKNVEVIYLYLPDLQALQAVAKEYAHSAQSFFQALDTMRLSDLITEKSFRVKVRVKGAKGALHTRQLSEGEQQLLTVIGLMRFTQNDESLYLLDEPDTHLNPTWGVEYINILRQIGGIEKKSHTLIATHDPLLVAGLCKEEIRVLKRDEYGKISSIIPEESPRGTGVASVLTSELFGLESQLDSFSLRVLNRIYEVSIADDFPNKQRHLKRLRKLIPSDLSPTDTYADPYRNIAKLAYNITTDNIIGSDNDSQWKSKAIEKLSSMLYSQSEEK